VVAALAAEHCELNVPKQEAMLARARDTVDNNNIDGDTGGMRCVVAVVVVVVVVLVAVGGLFCMDCGIVTC